MNKDLTYQAYYTKSDPILNYMAMMLHFEASDDILEPCGGDGVFVDKIIEQIPNAKIDVFELNPATVLGLKHKYNLKSSIIVKETDTFIKRYQKVTFLP